MTTRANSRAAILNGVRQIIQTNEALYQAWFARRQKQEQEQAMFGPRHITQKYMRRYGETARVRAWARRMVHIRTENGVWRINGAGYTYPGKPDAWVLPFEEAVYKIAHCGPEKQGCFLLAGDQPDVKP